MRAKEFGFVVGFALGLPLAARAEEPSSYCRKVEERAAADASLLFAPQLQLQGLKFPRDGAIDLGTVAGDPYQLRAGLSISAVDVYRGFGVLSLGDADCRQHRAVADITDLLAQGQDYGRLVALNKQAALLEARRRDWESILAKTAERVEAHVIGLVEANDVRARVAELEHKLSQVQGDIARIEAAHHPRPRAPLGALVAAAEASAMDYEERQSRLRRLAAWEARVTGGVVPQDKPVDYYGILQIGFNFGSFWQSAHEARALEARREEIRHARYELPALVRRFHDELTATKAQAEKDLAVADKQWQTLSLARGALAEAQAPGAPHALAVLDLELTSVEAERTYLAALVEELARVEEDRP